MERIDRAHPGGDIAAPPRLSRRRLLQSALNGVVGTGLLAVLAACAGKGRGDTGGDGRTAFATEIAEQRVAVTADPGGLLRWTEQEYRARPGDVTFVVSNPSSLVHNFIVSGPGINARSANLGTRATRNYTLRALAPGSYQIVCDFPGHREAGMVARLTVA